MPEEVRSMSPLYRNSSFKRDSVNEDERTVEIAFSSEEPVGRWDGNEVLDHDSKSVRLGRLADGGPLLVDHDPRDHVGVIESVEIGKDRKGRALVRFGRSARADEIFQDVVDGIRKSISVGYRIYKAITEERGEDGDPETYRVTDWEPFEISFVSVPADATVGVGRSEDTAPENDFIVVRKDDEATTEEPEMPKENEKQPVIEPVDTAAIRASAEKEYQARALAVLEAAEAVGEGELGAEVLRSGGDVNDFNAAYIRHMQETKPVPAAEIGLTEEETREFSFLRAINALANPQDKRLQEAAGFEFECSRAASDALGKDAQGIMVPIDVLSRDLTVGTATAGGHTVSTDLLSGSFIDMLRNRAVMMQLATVLSGLNGNIAIPRQTGGATAYWVAESGSPTESQQAFDQVTMSPETVGAFTDVSRKLMLQSSISVEQFVRNDLATTLALEIDRVAINGSGTSNEPEGILNVSGIGDVAGGTNGLAPTFDHMVDLETEVAQDNADVNRLAYITNAKVRGKLKKTEEFSGTGIRVWGNGNVVNGYNALVTNQVPSNLNKGTSTGVCSAVIFGNFADLIIGLWGGLDILVDPYTGGTAGTVRTIVHQDIDLAVRHAESFAAMQDALTA